MVSRVYVNTVRPGFREYRGGQVGPKPYVSNNAYLYSLLLWDYQPGTIVSMIDAESWLGPDQAQHNELYKRFVQAARGETSQLLTAAVEWNSSLLMVAKRANQFRRAYKAAGSGDLVSAMKWLGQSEIDKDVSRRWKKFHRAQRPTEAWLEYWMGWAPLVNDIYNAVDVIQRPTPDQKITVGVTRSYKKDSFIGKPGNPGYKSERRSTSVTLAAYAKAKVTNQNLFLANELGLLNPAQTAWEVVPFSFVVDWFTNVGQVLGSLTDFAGLSFRDAGTAHYMTNEYTRTQTSREWVPGFSSQQLVTRSNRAHGTKKGRNPGGPPAPQLTLRLPHVSLSRAATAISLLVETLTSSKKR